MVPPPLSAVATQGVASFAQVSRGGILTSPQVGHRLARKRYPKPALPSSSE
jgi:hypothetical protein